MKLKPVVSALVLGAVFLGVAFALKVAERNGLIADDLGGRGFMVLIGLVIAGYGNVVPKQLKRPRDTIAAEQRVQSALRACGWTITLAGLTVAGVWATLPDVVAEPISMLTLLAAFLVVLSCGLTCRRGSDPEATAGL